MQPSRKTALHAPGRSWLRPIDFKTAVHWNFRPNDLEDHLGSECAGVKGDEIVIRGTNVVFPY